MRQFSLNTELYYSLTERGADVDVDFPVTVLAEQYDTGIALVSVVQDQDGEPVEIVDLLTPKQRTNLLQAAEQAEKESR
jgi:hypothetical protein